MLESQDACPNCGQELSQSLGRTLAAVLDAPAQADPAGPLADLDLDWEGELAQSSMAVTAPRVTAASSSVRSSLPLFPSPSGNAAVVTPSSASRPLSVRRTTPRVPRLRAPGRAAVPLALEFESPDGRSAADLSRAAGPGQTASLGRRLAAGLVDLVVLGLIDGAVIALTARLSGLPVEAAIGLPVLPLAVFLALLDVWYVAVLTGLGGQTIGKMTVGIRVVSADGGPLGIGGALTRIAAYAVSVLPAGVGLLGLLVGSHRALHDRLAGTDVVSSL